MKPEVFDVAAQFYIKISIGRKPSSESIADAKKVLTTEDGAALVVARKRFAAKATAKLIEKHLHLLEQWINADRAWGKDDIISLKYAIYCSKSNIKNPNRESFIAALNNHELEDNIGRYCVKALQKRIAVWDECASKLKEVL